MANGATLPTVVIGAGQAGIEIVSTISDVAEERGVQDHFKYIALDTNQEALNEDAPDDAVTIFLKNPQTFQDEDKKKYPYLTEEMDIGAKGAQRKRPVGRYKLDNREPPADFSDRFDEIERHIRNHYSEYDNTLLNSNRSLNIILVHSLGGGTGSGTYPLLAAMVDRIAEELRDNIFVYTAAVGVLPEFGIDVSLKDLEGKPIYYANSYGSLSDLTNLISASEDEPLRLPVWSRRLAFRDQDRPTRAAIDEALESHAFNMDSAPFNHYFLVGINESKIQGEYGGQQIESYAEMIDNTIAEGIYGLSRFGGSLENWARADGQRAFLATLAQTEVAIPYEELRQYCLKKNRIEELETLLYDGFDDVDLDDDEDIVKRIVRNPEFALRTIDNPGQVEKEIEDIISKILGAGRPLVNRTQNEIRESLERIEAEHSLRFVPLAVDKIEEKYDEITPKIKDDHEEVVTDLWMEYDMSSNSSFGGEMISSVAGKERALRDYFDAKIEEYEEILEELEPSFWDGLPLIPGQREKHEAWLESFRESQSKLIEAKENRDRLEELKNTIEEERSRVKSDFQEQADKLDDLKRDVRSMARVLTDEQRYANRIGYLPIEDDRLDDITLTKLEEELDSLATFVERGYVDEQYFRDALEVQLNRCYAWEDTVMQFDSEHIDGMMPRGVQEMWFLFSEANREQADLSHVDIEGDFRASDSKGEPSFITDDYTLRFISFFEAGQADALDIFVDLERMTEDGTFDEYLQREDWRHSFAYMEWYDRHIREAFNIDVEIELQRPPELEMDDLDLDAESEGERKNIVKTYGLNRYLFDGRFWDKYEGDSKFDGWRERLDEVGIGFRDLQHLSPPAEKKSHWLAGELKWEKLLDEYLDTIADKEGVKIRLKAEAEG